MLLPVCLASLPGPMKCMIECVLVHVGCVGGSQQESASRKSKQGFVLCDLSQRIMICKHAYSQVRANIIPLT